MAAVDFDARPALSVLLANKVTSVGRYVGPASWGKCISLQEAQEYLDYNISTWLVFEQGTNDAAGGTAAGSANAKLAIANTPSCFKSGVVYYFAVDEEINPETAVAYFQGINQVLPASRVGVYGEGALCTLLHSLGLATFFWQSNSTSFPGNATTLEITNIQQKVGGPIPDTDEDIILKPDWGQYPRPGGNVADFPNAVGAQLTSTGKGSWVVGSDGGVFTTGDATFHGSLGGVKLAAPIVGIARSWGGQGYYLWGADGGVFAFGDAGSYGSYPGLPAADRVGTRSFGAGSLTISYGGTGYTLVALDGSRYSFPA